ncbi:hypothetical protein JMJ77_0015201, partial [Colletotrichum scovillei]
EASLAFSKCSTPLQVREEVGTTLIFPRPHENKTGAMCFRDMLILIHLTVASRAMNDDVRP